MQEGIEGHRKLSGITEAHRKRLYCILAQKEYRNTIEGQKGAEGHLRLLQNAQKETEGAEGAEGTESRPPKLVNIAAFATVLLGSDPPGTLRNIPNP